MIVRRLLEIVGSPRDVSGETWTSRRLLLAHEGMGFSLHDTLIHAGTETRMHYKHHLEAVYCVEGEGTLELNTANTFTGATEINFGTVEANATGSLANTSNIRVNGGSLLVTADNAIGDSTAMDLAGGTLEFSGSITETLGSLTLSAKIGRPSCVGWPPGSALRSTLRAWAGCAATSASISASISATV